MTDNELLLAISDLMDQKFKIELKPIKEDICRLKNDVTEIKADITVMKAKIVNIEQRLDRLETRMDRLETRIDKLEVRVDSIETNIVSMQDEMSRMSERMLKIELQQENQIIPRLSTIESCYLDTYRRYLNNADRVEGVISDMEIVKRVVGEHSQKLQKIS